MFIFLKIINVFVVAGSSRHSWLHQVWFQKIKVSKIKIGTVEMKHVFDEVMNEIKFLPKCRLQPKF